MNKHDQAFPIDTNGDMGILPGLSKREYFAAAAMTGLLSNDAAMQMIAKNAQDTGSHPAKELGKAAAMFADSVLATLSPIQAVQ